MAFRETTSENSICNGEIEIANLATEFTFLCEDGLLFPADGLRISLLLSMESHFLAGFRELLIRYCLPHKFHMSAAGFEVQFDELPLRRLLDYPEWRGP